MAVSLLMMPTLHVGHGTHLGGLSVFPIWTDGAIVTGLDTGRMARVQVDEREGSPVVGELVLKNEGAKPALLVAGELFEGGWQHRALNNDILLMPGHQQRRQRCWWRCRRRCWAGSAARRRAGRWHRGYSSVARPAGRAHRARWPAGVRGGFRLSLRPSTPPAGAARGRGDRRCTLAGAADAWSASSSFRRALDRCASWRRAWCRRRIRQAMASRSPYHEIRGLGWDDHLLHATVFNRRHHLMEVA